MMLTKLAGVALVAAAACANILGPEGSGWGPGDEGVMEISFRDGTAIRLPVRKLAPPPEYRRWHKQMAQCSGMPGTDFEGIEWFLTPDGWRPPTDTSSNKTIGLYLERKRQIILAESYLDSALVTHEALHDVLYRGGWRARPTGPVDSATGKRMYTKADLHPSPPYGFCAPF